MWPAAQETGAENPAMKEIVLLGDRTGSFTHREFDAVIERLAADVRIRWVATDSADAKRSSEADGLWVAAGSPYRSDDAVYSATQSARTSGQPFLGTCSGFQYAVVEFARNVAGVTDAAHAETAPAGRSMVVERLACSLEAQERLVTCVPETRMHRLCGDAPFVGFHWCNYGVGARHVERLANHGLIVAATAPDAGVEAIELSSHPFFLATLFQPQVGAGRGQPLHPVIRGFLRSI
jgi:CTP synthase (UTP-ammonia lyase)